MTKSSFKIDLSEHSSIIRREDGKIFIRFFDDQEEVGKEALVVGLRISLQYLTEGVDAS